MVWTFALLVFVASALWVAYIRLARGKKVYDFGPSIAMSAGLGALCAVGGLFGWPVWVLFVSVLGVIAVRRLPGVVRWAAGRYIMPVR